MKLKFIFNPDILDQSFLTVLQPVTRAYETFMKILEPDGSGFNDGSELTVTPLDLFPFGEPARVIAVSGTGAVARRLMEMGVVPGARVQVIKAAPLGDPLEVRVRGYHLALRRAEAHTIKVVTSVER